MNNVNEFTVVSSNPTKNGNFCNKLQNKSEMSQQTVFGQAKSERQTTYYLFTDKANSVGMVGALDITQFDVLSKPYKAKKNDGTIEVVQLKYLYPKS
jgi:hypothetical protein